MASQIPSNQPLDLASMSPAEQRALLTRLLQEKTRLNKRFPMSAGQQGLWHAFRRDPSATPFNVFLPSRYRDVLKVQALQQAIEWVARRHPCLRTVFSDAGGELTQEVRDELLPEFTVQPLLGASDDEARATIVAETVRPFDLETGPLLRLKLYQLASDDWIVLACTHHIIVDFWSLVVILQELRQGLAHFTRGPQGSEGRVPNELPSGASYADFVREQGELLRSPRGQAMQSYWLEQAQLASPVLDLPLDRLRPSVFTGRAASVPLPFGATTGAQVSRLAHRIKATNFAVVHASLQVFLGRLSQQSSFYIGSPFSGRMNAKFERTVGFFVNMLPLQVELDERLSFVDLIQHTSRTLLAALENEMVPIADIVHAARIPRDPSRSPLFQVSCTYEKSHVKEEAGRAGFLFPTKTIEWEFGGLKQESFYVPHSTCHYDLEFVFEQTGEELQGLLLYCSDLWEPETAKHLAAHFCQLVECLLNNANRPLSEVAWPVAAEPTSKISRWTEFSGNPETHTETLCDLFYAAAQDQPTAMALQIDQRGLSYAEWMGAAERTANVLRDLSIGPGDLVPVIAERGPLAFLAIMAVQLCGAAAVPVDASQPAIAWPQLATDTGCKLLLADELQYAWLVATFAETRPTVLRMESLFGSNLEEARGLGVTTVATALPDTGPVIADIDNQHAAYVVYTSGSTGKPKGVIIEHAAVVNTMRWRQQAVPLTSSDRVLMLLSHQFDAGLGMAWTTLTQGATLVWPDTALPPDDLLAPNGTLARENHATPGNYTTSGNRGQQARVSVFDPQPLIDQIQRDGITVLPAIPSLMKVLVQHPDFVRCRTLRYLWTGGEAMPSDLPAQVRRVTQARLWNFYGPTEAAIEATAADVTDHPMNRQPPIGWPIAGAEVLIVDAHQRPVPMTLPGEIAIAGAGLARGYLNAPELTDRKFIPHPCAPQSGRRAYLTGDRGRRRSDGQIEFLGRSDFQVKLRGYRIELGEIEAVLEAHPLVRRAAVTVMEANTPAASLAAFLEIDLSAIPSAAGCLGEPLDERLDKHAQATGAVEAALAEVRAAAREQLAPYKVPTAWQVLPRLPLNTSGKVDRKQLPSHVAASATTSSCTPPRTPLEAHLEQLWCSVLTSGSIGVERNFFDAGGSSLQAAIVTSRISTDLGVSVPTSLLFDLADIAQLAMHLVVNQPEVIAQRFGAACVAQQLQLQLQQTGRVTAASGPPSVEHPLIAGLKTTGSHRPIFMVHPPGGIVVCYRELAGALATDQPLYAIRSRGLHAAETLPQSLREMAADYLAAMQTVQPAGPYVVGGWSLGGLVAYEIAQLLLEQGEQVSKLILLDTTIPVGSTDLVPASEQVNVGLEYGIELSLDELAGLGPEEQLPFLWQHAQQLGVLSDDAPPEVVEQALRELQGLFHHHVQLARRYRPLPLAADVLLIRPREVPFELQVREDRGWRFLARSVEVRFVAGHHHSMVQQPHVQELAAAVRGAGLRLEA